MSAEKIKTSYPELEPYPSFWEAVFAFTTLKEVEGRTIARDLMTDLVLTSAALSNPGNEGTYAPRTSALQEKAFESFFALLNDETLSPSAMSVSLEGLWETAEV